MAAEGEVHLALVQSQVAAVTVKVKGYEVIGLAYPVIVVTRWKLFAPTVVAVPLFAVVMLFGNKVIVQVSPEVFAMLVHETTELLAQLAYVQIL